MTRKGRTQQKGANEHWLKARAQSPFSAPAKTLAASKAGAPSGEQAAEHSREAANLRDESATLREANERLVIATVRAQRMTEAAEHATAQMQESQKRLSLAMEVAQLDFWEIHLPSGRIVGHERLFHRLGYAPGEIEPSFEDWLRLIHPDDVSHLERALQEQAGEMCPALRVEIRHRAKSGEWRRILTQAEVIERDTGGCPIRLIGVTEDITGRKQAEDKLRQQAMLLDLAPDPIMVWDDIRGIRYWNSACEQLYGYAWDEAQGKPPQELLQTVFPVSREACQSDLQMRGRWDGEVRHTTRDGRSLTVESWMRCLSIDGETVILEANRSITERKLLEQNLQRINEELENRIEDRTAELFRKNKALEGSNLELQQFAYIAAHDLQTPLRSITSFSQLLYQGYHNRLDAQADQWLEILISASRRMHELIRDVLAYSRIDSRGSSLRPTDSGRLFDEVTVTLDEAIRESGAQVTRDDLPVVMADPSQLAQVLQNLIDNGIKYHGATPPRVHVSAEQRGAEWVFSVRDNGIGIAEKHWAHIFDIFHRLHTQQAYAGTGIGLAVCRRVIHRHGGRIWVESVPGQGSTFYFTLPNSAP